MARSIINRGEELLKLARRHQLADMAVPVDLEAAIAAEGLTLDDITDASFKDTEDHG